MKLPAFQFYPGDWRKDPGVQSLGYHDRGVWFEMLCIMHESSARGVLLLNNLPMPEEALAKLLGLDKQILTTTITTLLTYGVASKRESDGAIYSRRMVKDEMLRKVRAEAGKQGGNPVLVKQKPTTGVKQKATPSSSSSSSSSEEEHGSPPEESLNTLTTHVRETLLTTCRDSAPEMLREGLEDGGIDAALDAYPLTDQNQIPVALKNYIAHCRAEKTAPEFIRSLPSFLRKSRDCPRGFWRNHVKAQPLGRDGPAIEELEKALKDSSNRCMPRLPDSSERLFRELNIPWRNLQDRIRSGERLSELVKA